VQDFSFVNDGSERLDVFLAKKTGESRSFIKNQILHGQVQVNSMPVTKVSERLKPGDVVSGAFQQEIQTKLEPIAYPLDILFEDEALVIINKPQGMVVHPAPGHRGETLVHYLLHHLEQNRDFLELEKTRPGIVHRLDRGTSGVLVVAKNRKALEKMALQFKARTLKKIYEAIVWGRTKPEGTIKSALGRHVSDRKKMSSRTRKSREALTIFKRLMEFPHFSHLEVHPWTGRTHQIRVHLSEAGHPIVGDELYATRSLENRKKQLSPMLPTALETITAPFLHARDLEFTHPLTGRLLRISALRPTHFQKFLDLIRGFDK